MRSLELLFLWLRRLGLGLALALGSLSAQTYESVLAELQQPGRVLLIRHALAPGTGDPAGFVLGDCSTQRNLSERGRSQARRLGERLRAAGLDDLRVFTSQWCRCQETGRLLGVGPVQDLPALNSFFANPAQEEPKMRELRGFLAELPRDGRLVVLVTHQVNITSLTGYFPATGAGLVLSLEPEGKFRRVAEWPAEN